MLSGFYNKFLSRQSGNTAWVWRMKLSMNKNLLITVLDNGCGMEENKISELLELNNQSNNIGCNNVHKRIQYYYGEEYGLEITSKVNYFTRTIIRLPIMK